PHTTNFCRICNKRLHRCAANSPVASRARLRFRSSHEPSSPPVQTFVAYATKVCRRRFMASMRGRKTVELSMNLRFRRFDLKLAHRWAIARSVQPGGSGGTDIYKVVFVELTDTDGTMGMGEAAP